MSSLNVHRAMLSLMDALSECIVVTEAMANELFRSADELTDQFGGDAIRETARRKRVRALEMQGQLVALKADYAKQFGAHREFPGENPF